MVRAGQPKSVEDAILSDNLAGERQGLSLTLIGLCGVPAGVTEGLPLRRIQVSCDGRTVTSLQGGVLSEGSVAWSG